MISGNERHETYTKRLNDILWIRNGEQVSTIRENRAAWMMEKQVWERKEQGKSVQREKAQGIGRGEWDLFSPANHTYDHKHIESFSLLDTGTILVGIGVCVWWMILHVDVVCHRGVDHVRSWDESNPLWKITKMCTTCPCNIGVILSLSGGNISIQC